MCMYATYCFCCSIIVIDSLFIKFKKQHFVFINRTFRNYLLKYLFLIIYVKLNHNFKF